jgi:anti-sigma-K factor RskA
MNCEEVDELIGAYALGALPGETLAAVRGHLATCENHPQTADLRVVASSLAFAAPEMEPPPALKGRLMAAVREAKPKPAMTAAGGGLLSALRGLAPQRVIPYALAGALAVAIGVLILTNTGDSNEPSQTAITLSGTDEASAVLHVLEDGIIVMEADGLEPLDSEHTYQVWAITSGTPTSLGLLGPATSGEALGVMRADLSGVEAVAVTAEPAGGSVTPTTDPILQTEDLTS